MAQRPRDLEPESSAAALFGAELRQRRVVAGLSQAQLARMVHVSCDLIGKVEKAQRRVLTDLAARLDDALDAGGDLVSLARDVAARQVPLSPKPQPVLPSMSGDDIARALREVLSGIRRLDHGLGSGHAVPALMAHAQLSEALLTSLGRRAQREVLLTLGEMHQLAGWIAFDHGELGPAQQAFVKARSYAELAGSDALVAYILGPSHGFAVTYSGDPRNGARRSDEALVRARRSGNRRLTAFVLAIGARAYAKLGDGQPCLAMLDQAEEQLAEHRPDEPDPVWLEVFDEAALRGHRGSCLVDLGQAARAIEPLAVQDASAPRLFARNRTIWLLDRARAHAALSDVEAACSAVDQALDVATGTSSARTSSQLRSAAAFLSQWTSVPDVARLQERVRTELLA